MPPSHPRVQARALGLKALAEVQRRLPKGVPLLDPEEDMRIAVGREGCSCAWLGLNTRPMVLIPCHCKCCLLSTDTGSDARLYFSALA